MHRRLDDDIVTEDDINEVKGDISAMRYELLEVFERNGMDISTADKKEKSHLAKRMKVWERRLMKDFHVAPSDGGEGGEAPEKGSEKGLARFRRVAHEVVQSTTTHKWTEAVAGITDTQIGRCRNRESFRNQQNLAKAMSEAKRLVQHSPIQSRPCTPLEYSDPTTNTLLELLKNISEEIDEYPGTRPTSKQERESSILQLHAMIGSKTSSPLPSNIVQLAESMAKIDDQKQRQSITSTLSQISNELNQIKSRSRSGSFDARYKRRNLFLISFSIDFKTKLFIHLFFVIFFFFNRNRGQDFVQSPPPLPRSSPPVSTSPESRSPKSKSPEPRGRKSITSINSNGSIGEPSGRIRSPSPTSKPMVPLPEIQITRTESNRSTVDEKWVKPKELEEDKSKKLN